MKQPKKISKKLLQKQSVQNKLHGSTEQLLIEAYLDEIEVIRDTVPQRRATRTFHGTAWAKDGPRILRHVIACLRELGYTKKIKDVDFLS